MNGHEHHDGLLRDLSLEYREILDGSDQGVYIYLDDLHKLCNTRFATLLGYRSPDEWARVEGSFPDAFVAVESQEALIGAYQDALERSVGSTFPVVWKQQAGGSVKTTVILVPIAHGGHVMALHFVDEQ